MAGVYKERAEALRLLDLEDGATQEEIKAAYKKAALKCHPDKNPNDPQATNKFQELGKAFKHLTSPESDDEESPFNFFYDDDDDDDDGYVFSHHGFPDIFTFYLFNLLRESRLRREFNFRYNHYGYEEDPPDEQEDNFYDNMRKQFGSRDEEPTEEDLNQFHSYDEWKEAKTSKKKNGRRRRKRGKVPTVEPPKLNKKQLRAQQRQKEKETEVIREQLLKNLKLDGKDGKPDPGNKTPSSQSSTGTATPKSEDAEETGRQEEVERDKEEVEREKKEMERQAEEERQKKENERQKELERQKEERERQKKVSADRERKAAEERALQKRRKRQEKNQRRKERNLARGQNLQPNHVPDDAFKQNSTSAGTPSDPASSDEDEDQGVPKESLLSRLHAMEQKLDYGRDVRGSARSQPASSLKQPSGCNMTDSIYRRRDSSGKVLPSSKMDKPTMGEFLEAGIEDRGWRKRRTSSQTDSSVSTTPPPPTPASPATEAAAGRTSTDAEPRGTGGKPAAQRGAPRRQSSSASEESVWGHKVEPPQENFWASRQVGLDPLVPKTEREEAEMLRKALEMSKLAAEAESKQLPLDLSEDADVTCGEAGPEEWSSPRDRRQSARSSGTAFPSGGQRQSSGRQWSSSCPEEDDPHDGAVAWGESPRCDRGDCPDQSNGRYQRPWRGSRSRARRPGYRGSYPHSQTDRPSLPRDPAEKSPRPGHPEPRRNTGWRDQNDFNAGEEEGRYCNEQSEHPKISQPYNRRGDSGFRSRPPNRQPRGNWHPGRGSRGRGSFTNHGKYEEDSDSSSSDELDNVHFQKYGFSSRVVSSSHRQQSHLDGGDEKKSMPERSMPKGDPNQRRDAAQSRGQKEAGSRSSSRGSGSTSRRGGRGYRGQAGNQYNFENPPCRHLSDFQTDRSEDSLGQPYEEPESLKGNGGENTDGDKDVHVLHHPECPDAGERSFRNGHNLEENVKSAPSKPKKKTSVFPMFRENDDEVASFTFGDICELDMADKGSAVGVPVMEGPPPVGEASSPGQGGGGTVDVEGRRGARDEVGPPGMPPSLHPGFRDGDGSTPRFWSPFVTSDNTSGDGSLATELFQRSASVNGPKTAPSGDSAGVDADSADASRGDADPETNGGTDMRFIRSDNLTETVPPPGFASSPVREDPLSSPLLGLGRNDGSWGRTLEAAAAVDMGNGGQEASISSSANPPGREIPGSPCSQLGDVGSYEGTASDVDRPHLPPEPEASTSNRSQAGVSFPGMSYLGPIYCPQAYPMDPAQLAYMNAIMQFQLLNGYSPYMMPPMPGLPVFDPLASISGASPQLAPPSKASVQIPVGPKTPADAGLVTTPESANQTTSVGEVLSARVPTSTGNSPGLQKSSSVSNVDKRQPLLPTPQRKLVHDKEPAPVQAKPQGKPSPKEKHPPAAPPGIRSSGAPSSLKDPRFSAREFPPAPSSRAPPRYPPDVLQPPPMSSLTFPPPPPCLTGMQLPVTGSPPLEGSVTQPAPSLPAVSLPPPLRPPLPAPLLPPPAAPSASAPSSESPAKLPPPPMQHPITVPPLPRD